MTTAALYIRVSTIEQANKGYSLKAQQELLTKYCKENDISVYKVYADEGKSANKALSKRTALLKMLSDAERGCFNIICFKDITRWSRSASQYFAVQDRLDKAGVSWIAVDQPYLETRTPTGRFTVSIMLGTAQLESENTSQRIRFVFDSMIRSGIVPYSGKLVPFGYKVEVIDGVRKLVKDRTLPVDDMFNHLLEYRNMSRTVVYMYDTYGIRLTISRMSRISHNPIYTGVYNGIPNFTEPYLTEEQFQELQNFDRKRFPQAKHSSNYIFKSLLKCASCGRAMQGSTVFRRGKTIIYYRCPNRYLLRTCDADHYARQDRIEAEVMAKIKPEFDQLKYKIEIESGGNVDYSAQIDRQNAKLKRLTEVYIEGSIDRETYDTRKAAIQQEIDKISQVEHIDISELEKFLNSPWQDLYNALTDEEKGRFFRSFIDSIWFDGEKVSRIDFKNIKA